MAQLFKTRPHGPGRVLVQNAGHGRAMIIPDIIPELTAYLYMIGQRYERTYRTTQLATKRHSDAYLKGIERYTLSFIDCVQKLVDILSDKFARHEWWVAWSDICDKFNICDRIKFASSFELDDTYTEGGGI